MKRKKSNGFDGVAVYVTGVQPGILYAKSKPPRSNVMLGLIAGMGKAVRAALSALAAPVVFFRKLFGKSIASNKGKMHVKALRPMQSKRSKAFMRTGTIRSPQNKSLPADTGAVLMAAARSESATVTLCEDSGEEAEAELPFQLKRKGYKEASLVARKKRSGKRQKQENLTVLLDEVLYHERTKKRIPLFFKIASGALALGVSVFLLTGAIIGSQTRTITINDAGKTMTIKTTSEDVAALLGENNIVLGDGDLLSVQPEAPVNDEMNIIIKRAGLIQITTGKEQVVVALASGTVEDALKKADITIEEQDLVEPALHTRLTDVTNIVHTKVSTEYETNSEKLAFNEVTVKDSNMLYGKSSVSEGTEGEKRIRTKVVYHNGEEVSREITDETVVSEPVDQITYVGTYIPPTPKPTPAPTPKPKTNTSGSSKANANTNTGGSAQVGYINPNLVQFAGDTRSQTPPTEDQIAQVYTMKATAYYDINNTGSTATGAAPVFGTVAVSPSIIPYGTRMWIEGYGYGIAQDTGGFARNNPYQVDVFVPTLSMCYQWGMRSAVKVYILK